jgi:hypothetical protein
LFVIARFDLELRARSQKSNHSSEVSPKPAGLLAIAATVRFDGFSDLAKRWYIADRGEQESFA